MVEHAIRAGEALLEARNRCEAGRWIAWLTENFDATPYTAQSYIRVAYQAEAVRESGATSFTGAFAYLREKGLPGPYPGFGKDSRHPDEVREEALRLLGEGASANGAARLLGISPRTVRRWVDPKHAAQWRAANRQRKAAERRERKAREAEVKAQRIARAARAAGGGIADAYAMAEKMQDVLGRAHGEATDSEARRALAVAGEHYRKMRDEIVRALGVS